MKRRSFSLDSVARLVPYSNSLRYHPYSTLIPNSLVPRGFIIVLTLIPQLTRSRDFLKLEELAGNLMTFLFFFLFWKFDFKNSQRWRQESRTQCGFQADIAASIFEEKFWGELDFLFGFDVRCLSNSRFGLLHLPFHLCTSTRTEQS